MFFFSWTGRSRYRYIYLTFIVLTFYKQSWVNVFNLKHHIFGKYKSFLITCKFLVCNTFTKYVMFCIQYFYKDCMVDTFCTFWKTITRGTSFCASSSNMVTCWIIFTMSTNAVTLFSKIPKWAFYRQKEKKTCILITMNKEVGLYKEKPVCMKTITKNEYFLFILIFKIRFLL